MMRFVFHPAFGFTKNSRRRLQRKEDVEKKAVEANKQG